MIRVYFPRKILAFQNYFLSKTELMWAGTKYNVASLLRIHDPSLTLGANTVKVSYEGRVLRVLFTPNLALEKHANDS